MGSYVDHGTKIRHIREDIGRHAAHKGVVPSHSCVEDLCFCAYNVLDRYLAFYDIHPVDREHRERVVGRLTNLMPALSVPWRDYRKLSDAAAATDAGKDFSPQEVGDLLPALTSLEDWINKLPL